METQLANTSRQLDSYACATAHGQSSPILVLILTCTHTAFASTCFNYAIAYTAYCQQKQLRSSYKTDFVTPVTLLLEQNVKHDAQSQATMRPGGDAAFPHAHLAR